MQKQQYSIEIYVMILLVAEINALNFQSMEDFFLNVLFMLVKIMHCFSFYLCLGFKKALTQQFKVPISSYMPSLAQFNNLLCIKFLPLILLEHEGIEKIQDLGLPNQIIFPAVTGISLVLQLIIWKTYQIEVFNSICTYDFICISGTNFDSSVPHDDKNLKNNLKKTYKYIVCINKKQKRICCYCI